MGEKHRFIPANDSDQLLALLKFAEHRYGRFPTNQTDQLHGRLFTFAERVPQIKPLVIRFIHQTINQIGISSEDLHRGGYLDSVNIALGTDLKPSETVVPEDLVTRDDKRLYFHDLAHFQRRLFYQKKLNPELASAQDLWDYVVLADFSLTYLTGESARPADRGLLVDILTAVYHDLPTRPEYQPARLEIEELRYLLARLFQIPASYSYVSLPGLVREFLARNQFEDKNQRRPVEASIASTDQFIPPVEVDVGGVCVMLRNLLSDVAGNPVSESGPIPAMISFVVRTEKGQPFLIMQVMNEGYLLERQLKDIGRVPIVATDGETLRGIGKVSNRKICSGFLEHCGVAATTIRHLMGQQWANIAVGREPHPFVVCSIPFAIKSVTA